MLRVTNERVQQVSERTGFPEPVVVLAGGPVWDRAEIEAWARARGNGGR